MTTIHRSASATPELHVLHPSHFAYRHIGPRRPDVGEMLAVLGYDSPTIMVGGRESYEARCRHCHKVPRKDEDQTRLL